MKVILLTDVKKVGRKNETKEVANGYAQNVLIPQKLALPATPENLKRFQRAEEKVANKKAFDEALLIKNIRDLEGKTLTMNVRANENGTLFQTVHTKDIGEAILSTFAVTVPESFIQAEDIKRVGEYTAVLSVGKVSLPLSVVVV